MWDPTVLPVERIVGLQGFVRVRLSRCRWTFSSLLSVPGMPVVMFAGEATHRQYPGTAHGAYMSGYREANRLLEALEQQDILAAWSHTAAAAAAAAATMQQEVSLGSTNSRGSTAAMPNPAAAASGGVMA